MSLEEEITPDPKNGTAVRNAPTYIKRRLVGGIADFMERRISLTDGDPREDLGAGQPIRTQESAIVEIVLGTSDLGLIRTIGPGSDSWNSSWHVRFGADQNYHTWNRLNIYRGGFPIISDF